jgi:hypothetical protein
MFVVLVIVTIVLAAMATGSAAKKLQKDEQVQRRNPRSDVTRVIFRAWAGFMEARGGLIVECVSVVGAVVDDLDEFGVELGASSVGVVGGVVALASQDG